MTTRHEIDLSFDPINSTYTARLCSDPAVAGAGASAASALRNMLRAARHRREPTQARLEPEVRA